MPTRREFLGLTAASPLAIGLPCLHARPSRKLNRIEAGGKAEEMQLADATSQITAFVLLSRDHNGHDALAEVLNPTIGTSRFLGLKNSLVLDYAFRPESHCPVFGFVVKHNKCGGVVYFEPICSRIASHSDPYRFRLEIGLDCICESCDSNIRFVNVFSLQSQVNDR